MNADNKKVKWSSTDESVATVCEGLVTAVSIGSARIIAVSEDNGKTATCPVTVESQATEGSLSISISSITESTCKVSISTTSARTYFSAVCNKANWDEYGVDSIWDAYISYLSEMGQLDEWIGTGNCSDTIIELDPQTEYVVFAAFCDNNGKREGDVYSKTFTTQNNNSGSTGTLSIKVSNITESSCSVSVSPSSNNAYYWDIIKETQWKESGGDEVWNSVVESLGDDFSLALSTGKDNFDFSDLDSQTEYVVFAAFCDNNGKRIGDFYTSTFTTKKESAGNNDNLGITISNITESTCRVSITTTSLNTYYWAIKEKSKWDQLGGAAIWNSDFSSSSLSQGNVNYNYSGLNQQTEYIVYAAFCDNRGNRTSDFYTGIFVTTNKESSGDGPATLSMTDIWCVSCTSANIKGIVTDFGGTYSYNSGHHGGFVISTSPNPTIHTPDVIDITYYPTKNEEYGKKITKLKPNTKYYVRTYVISGYGTTYSNQLSFTTCPVPNGAVDLGLPSGLLWCDHNLGGKDPEDYGGYYAWGETKEKSSYTTSSSVTYGNTASYVSSIQPYILLPQYDAAAKIMGNGWRLPTENELRELSTKCTKKYVERQNSVGQTVSGIVFTGPNGNSIFLPAAGHKESSRFIPLESGYWSSEHPGYKYFGCYMGFAQTTVTSFPTTGIQVYYGFSIRPVI